MRDIARAALHTPAHPFRSIEKSINPLKPTLSIMQATCKGEQQLKDSIIMVMNKEKFFYGIYMASMAFFAMCVSGNVFFCHWGTRCAVVCRGSYEQF